MDIHGWHLDIPGRELFGWMDMMAMDIHFGEYPLKMLDRAAPENLADKLVRDGSRAHGKRGGSVHGECPHLPIVTALLHDGSNLSLLLVLSHGDASCLALPLPVISSPLVPARQST
jgi:hypothetical protein